MVNCIPVFIAKDPGWRGRFEERGLPLIGDDVKSQVGATIVHRVLANLFRERGVRVDRTYQLNFGGNSDFRNMLERERLESKKRSKTNSLTSQLDEKLSDAEAHIGPSDFVPWLTDRKWAYIRIEGTSFGNLPLNCELKLEVWDSPNSAGVVIDAIRCAKLALDRRIGGALIGPSQLLHEEPSRAIHRLRGAGQDRGFHSRRAGRVSRKVSPSHRIKSRVPARRQPVDAGQPLDVAAIGLLVTAVRKIEDDGSPARPKNPGGISQVLSGVLGTRDPRRTDTETSRPRVPDQ